MKESAARRRWLLGLIGLAALGLWIAVAPMIADNLVVDRPLEKADAIVILSGAADYLQRARGGAEAFQEGIAPRVMITDDNQRGGWDDNEKGNPYFVDRMQTALVAHGVPSDVIERIPGQVAGTADEAEDVILTASQRSYRSVLIVTSDYHSRRALWTFERIARKQNADLNIGLLRSPSGDKYPDRYTWWLTPRGWRSVGAEYLKFCWYWLYY
ncbi:MAG: YdcF family protein [Acidobacteria bacterium]|nr:YdcF family protein [Acidobacteriota bacterium]